MNHAMEAAGLTVAAVPELAEQVYDVCRHAAAEEERIGHTPPASFRLSASGVMQTRPVSSSAVFSCILR